GGSGGGGRLRGPAPPPPPPGRRRHRRRLPPPGRDESRRGRRAARLLPAPGGLPPRARPGPLGPRGEDRMNTLTLPPWTACLSALRLDRWMMGELEAADAESIRAHVTACAGCSTALAGMRGVREELRSLPLPPPLLSHPPPGGSRAPPTVRWGWPWPRRPSWSPARQCPPNGTRGARARRWPCTSSTARRSAAPVPARSSLPETRCDSR